LERDGLDRRNAHLACFFGIFLNEYRAGWKAQKNHRRLVSSVVFFCLGVQRRCTWPAAGLHLTQTRKICGKQHVSLFCLGSVRELSRVHSTHSDTNRKICM